MLYSYSSRLMATLGGIALSLMMGSCEKSEEKPQVQTFTGQVQLYDQYGDPLTNNSGVKVSLADSTDIGTETTADGRYTLQTTVGGQQRLFFYKKDYGEYTSEPSELAQTTHTISRPIQIGEKPRYKYDYTYSRHDDAGYWIFNGKINPEYDKQLVDWPADKARFHRLFLDIAITHAGGPYEVKYFRFSKSIQDNQVDGFSDTIRYNEMRAKNISRSFSFNIRPYNAKADSCRIVLKCVDNIQGCVPVKPFIRPYFPGAGWGVYNAELLLWPK